MLITLNCNLKLNQFFQVEIARFQKITLIQSRHNLECYFMQSSEQALQLQRTVMMHTINTYPFFTKILASLSVALIDAFFRPL